MRSSAMGLTSPSAACTAAQHLHEAGDVLVGGRRQNGAEGGHVHLLEWNAAHIHAVLGKELSQHPAELVVVELQESVQAFLIQLHDIPLLPPQGLPSPKGRGERRLLSWYAAEKKV